MFEPTDERGAPSPMRFATCRSPRALSDGVPDILTTRTDNTQTIPETDDEAEKPYLEGPIRQNGAMMAQIALDRLIGLASAY